MRLKTIKDIDVKGKRVLVRVNFDVPLVKVRNPSKSSRGKSVKDKSTSVGIGDDWRIQAHLPTIQYLLKKKATVVLISHLGRPKGKKDKKLSLSPIAQKLAKILKIKSQNIKVSKYQEFPAFKITPNLILLENIRFYHGEEKNDGKFAKSLSKLGDIFVEDAFACAHRAHSSTVGITKYLPSVAGFLLEREIKTLSEAISIPKKPLVVIVGGAKISDKISLFYSLIEKADILIVGGIMASTFLKSQGVEIGQSLVEDRYLDEADEILREAESKGVEFLIPDDVACVKKISEDFEVENKDLVEIENDDIIVDIGPSTISKIAEPIKFAGTIIWNGPLGVTEIKQFSKGSESVAKMIIEGKAKSIIGGGDTIAFIDKLGVKNQFDFVSTGGGAMLEFLEGKELPGIKVLRD